MNQAIHWLVSITLIEMMIAIGLGVSWPELMRVAGNRHLILASLFTNYVCVPAAAFGLIRILNSPPSIAAGFLILAVCPGASYGPPITSFGKGNVQAAVGLMVLLAGSSAIFAPLMLHILLPLLLSGQESVTFDLKTMFGVLMLSQFAPLFVGLSIRYWHPAIAERLKGPADSVGLVLNCAMIGWLLATKLSLFDQLNLRGIIGMSVLLLISLASGWLFGGTTKEDRKALALTTSLRNLGLSLVIATGAFPGTHAVTAILGYGFFEILGSLLTATWWRWHALPIRQFDTT